MAIWQCTVCGYKYDEDKEKKKFEDLPADCKCPVCGAKKEMFKKL
ncbi:rubredoxin [Methanococcus voltae]|uniref:Rubredoxin-type Fe(Cys)4 protein n=1 Tax=Methanococcus voltae (strain ATCC BAA-1334 / A3) TaxID=456320 RepID=D7DUT4_METV3|nr:rubredoxin [Methanococcus voltae]MCS3900696.1 rubredoxin [Methanococcus voltae]